MRITTGMIYDRALRSMQQQTSKLVDAQEQVATGRRIVTPSDDPVAAARALEVSQSKSVNALYTSNQGYANDALALVDSKLGAATDVLTYARTRAVEAGNGSYSADELKAIAKDLGQQFDALRAIGNSRDASGEYVFAGYRSNAEPFTGDLKSGIAYAGDQGQRSLQISATRVMPVTSSGDQIFNQVRAAPGSAFALGAPSNASFVAGFQAGPAYNDHALQIDFDGTNYTLTDLTAGTPAATLAAPTVVGGNTVLNLGGGQQLTLAGTPAAGDRFDVKPRATSFEVLGNLVLSLDSGLKAASSFAATQAIGGMDGAIDSVARERSAVGSRMVEVDAQTGIGEDLDVQYKITLGRLQDADYAKSVSDLAEQKTYLEAAQQSFLRVSNLSLFNYLS